MSTSDFWRAAAAGFFGSFVMVVVAAWQIGIGVHPHDPAGLMAKTLDPLGTGRGWTWGSFYHYMNGITLALIYARFINGRVALHPLVLANLYGLALVVVAMGILAPMLAQQLGFFGINSGHPINLTIGSIIAHAAYATTLGLFYLPEPKRAAGAGLGEARARAAG